MKITDIRLRVNKNVEEDGKLKAYVDITFDESFVMHGLKIIESRRMPNGEYKDIVHPVTPELRTELTAEVLKEYEKEISK